MEKRRLGTTDLEVSTLGLGTMTWGEQNSEREAHAQLDMALERGVNFIDTAELYAVPPRAETYGRTEQFIGRWLKARGGRERIVLATKVVGPSRGLGWIRDGHTRLDKAHISAALDASLHRLETDHIDLYQLHWPDRATNMFGQRGFVPQEGDAGGEARPPIPLAETLAALQDLVQAGKIRHIGVSNETPWGVMHALHLAETRGLPRVQSIQNPYSLLNRSFEVGLAEVAWREHCGLLAYSPLAMGVLSGKYLDGQRPAGARLTRFQQMQRYVSPQAEAATRRYVALAREHGLNPAQMALAFVSSRPFVTSNLFGATSLAQLTENLDSGAVRLSPELLAALDAVHHEMPDPCP